MKKELLLTLKSGNRQSFAILYKEYWNQVYNSADFILLQGGCRGGCTGGLCKSLGIQEFIREDDNFKDSFLSLPEILSLIIP